MCFNKKILTLTVAILSLNVHAQMDASGSEKLKQSILQDVSKLELDKSPEVKAAVKVAQEAIYMRAWEQTLLKKNPITPAQRESAYKELLALLGNTEYRFQHLVLSDEEDAKKTIEGMNANPTWDAIDYKNGMKAETQINLQKTDWVNMTMLMPDFRGVVKNLTVGQVHAQPIKVQNLWHVIGLRESRPLATPQMNQIIQNVDKLAAQKIVNEKIKSLPPVKEKSKEVKK